MPERMLTADELGPMQDLSGAALFSAEVKRIPFIPRDQQSAYVEAAKNGEIDARHALITNCLNWTITKAASIYQDKQPEHSDLMDLVGHAHISMLEALPRALRARDPVRYLMAVSEVEMKMYCLYHDPMVQRPYWRAPTYSHPTTVSLEEQPYVLDAAEMHAGENIPDNPALRVVYDALAGMSSRRRQIVTAAYGLDGHPAMRISDIALKFDLSKKTVENYLYRSKRELARKLGPYLGKLGIR